MADDKSTDATDVDSGAAGSGDKSDADALKSQLEQLTSEVEAVKAKFNDAVKTRDDAKRKLRELERDRQEKDGDINGLKAAHAEDRQTWEEERARLLDEQKQHQAELRQLRVENKIRDFAAEYILPEALDDFLRLHLDDFELSEDKSVKVKKSYKSPKDYIRELSEKKPWIAKNQRSSGAGAGRSNADASGSSKLSLDDLKNMSRVERVKALAENPELLKAADAQATLARR